LENSYRRGPTGQRPCRRMSCPHWLAGVASPSDRFAGHNGCQPTSSICTRHPPRLNGCQPTSSICTRHPPRLVDKPTQPCRCCALCHHACGLPCSGYGPPCEAGPVCPWATRLVQAGRSSPMSCTTWSTVPLGCRWIQLEGLLNVFYFLYCSNCCKIQKC
jgi:hypothetical protein